MKYYLKTKDTDTFFHQSQDAIYFKAQYSSIGGKNTLPEKLLHGIEISEIFRCGNTYTLEPMNMNMIAEKLSFHPCLVRAPLSAWHTLPLTHLPRERLSIFTASTQR